MATDLPAARPGERWWIALVGFERGKGDQDTIPDHCEGAFGWLAGLAPNAEELALRIRKTLREVGLQALTIENEKLVQSFADIQTTDEHLAENVANLEHSKLIVWGTIHCYVAEGEA